MKNIPFSTDVFVKIHPSLRTFHPGFFYNITPFSTEFLKIKDPFLRLFHNQVQLSVTQRVKNQFSRLPFILFLLVSTTSWDNVCKGILHKNHYLTKYQYFITNTLMTILTLKMIHMRLFINLNESYLLNYRELESYIR